MTSTNQTNLDTMPEHMTDDISIDDRSSIGYTEEIETVIAGLAQDQKVMVGQSDAGHLWKFQYGSVTVFVQLTGETEDDTLTVWSPILQFPVKNEEQLMKRLLEMNWLSTFESHFAITNNQVVVLTTRTLAGITPGEISRVITIVATIADDNDDILIEEFGIPVT
ncbi:MULTISPECIES: YbjN domain-containing protein [Arthrospira]|uniref:YbjN domain-containing protein n=1 Tax=Limnospira platensis NIES-46 TaxID=1236695 RepID=A0A5M3T6A6_LIMPL|nr:YbjN domain-containing protein [Arthrospira platensis]AMW28993.1 hypothetical protein AP285_14535 [Arthrospira platensis YZ]KDR56543.1 hypothetical protein APPUASWS_016365 [Arthrospira platensis str. Paraca]MBD2671195.1 YbjN domain-containing protein [Arthrospira platensis FACHB-439]MBD2712127.1 YbjN domain-containing protein [Arthrospira platensis FACHB-835]MDF2212804.1 YbjN domain-containing protein [Arthrospira platensis NCB002]MDT9183725.1 YbjN domain-containing protein [Limnospira sp.